MTQPDYIHKGSKKKALAKKALARRSLTEAGNTGPPKQCGYSKTSGRSMPRTTAEPPTLRSTGGTG